MKVDLMKNKRIGIKRAQGYNNAEFRKLKNKSILVLDFKDDTYGIEFKIVSDDLRPRAKHTVFRNKVVSTTLRIDKKTAVVLAEAILKQYGK